MGHTEIMELLLENGALVNIKDNKGKQQHRGTLGGCLFFFVFVFKFKFV